MLEEPFAAGNSVIHGLDPRFRAASAIVYCIIVASVYSFPALGFALAVSISMILLARLELKRVFYRLLIVNGFVAFLWLVLPFTAHGGVVYQIGPLFLHEKGLLLAAAITIKSNAILMAIIALTATMPLAALGHAMNRLRFPEKLVYLLMLTYRYIFVLEQEYKKITRAVRIRGFIPQTSVHCYKTYAYIIGMLFVRASARAERVYGAMKCRGFTGKFYSLAQFRASLKNYVFTCLITIAAAGIIVLEYLPHE
ncbi:MAG: cobalt ECF transporter T component CbiQ [Desulfobacterales bacterium]